MSVPRCAYTTAKSVWRQACFGLIARCGVVAQRDCRYETSSDRSLASTAWMYSMYALRLSRWLGRCMLGPPCRRRRLMYADLSRHTHCMTMRIRVPRLAAVAVVNDGKKHTASRLRNRTQPSCALSPKAKSTAAPFISATTAVDFCTEPILRARFNCHLTAELDGASSFVPRRIKDGR